MTYQEDCSIQPQFRSFVDALARCFHEGDEYMKDPDKVSILFREHPVDAKQAVRKTGASIVETYGGTDWTVIVASGLSEQSIDDIKRLADVDEVVDYDGYGWNTPNLTGIEELCAVVARDYGMEFTDAGAARATFLAADQPMEATKDDGKVVTLSEKCVVKVARNGIDKADGREQNGEEIKNWESLPEELKGDVGGDGPIFNPLSDYSEDALWVTQPYCPPPGNAHEVMNRLRNRGYQIGDVANAAESNVGTYPVEGGSAIIDYGFRLERIDISYEREFDRIREELRDLGMDEIRTEVEHNGARVAFFTYDLPGETDMLESYFDMNEDGLFIEGSINTPGWSFSQFRSRDALRSEVEQAIGSPVSMSVDYEIKVFQTADDYTIDIRFEPDDLGPLPVSSGLKEVRNIVQGYRDHFKRYDVSSPGPGGDDDITDGVIGVETEEDFINAEAQWRNALDDAGMRSVNFNPGGRVDIEFLPPDDIEPRPADQTSSIYTFTDANVEAVNYHAAELTIGISGFTEANTEVRDVAQAVSDQFDGYPVRVTGALDHVDAGTNGEEVYVTRYSVRETYEYITPETVIDVLTAINREHGKAVDRLDAVGVVA